MKKMCQINNENDELASMLKKLVEETGEVIEGFEKKDKENIIEECLDVIQVILGLLWRVGIRDRKTLKHYIKIHNQKLKRRGWKFKKPMLK